MDTFRQFGCTTKVADDGHPISIGFRYPNGDIKVRLIDKKDFYWVKSGSREKHGLFGRDRFAAGSHKYVTITEGELDATSLYQVLASPVVSVSSASAAATDCSADRSWLNSFERIYLCFDNDPAGREATRNVAKLFDYNKVYDVRLTTRKDANEYLSAGEDGELRNIWWNSKKYLPESIVSSLSDFKDILIKPTKAGVAYPWKILTDMTYGVRTSESVLLTAQEGVGKTELMHAIEYHLLKETDDNVAAIFLEEPKQRHLLALAGLEKRQPIHLPDHRCSDTETFSALETILKKDDRLFVYSHFGSDDPEILVDTTRFLVSGCQCRYVLLDHISMAVSGLAGEDERRALDYLATRLEMMLKELDFALIMVSHVNDLGQTRGSRYISKIADIRIDAQRDLLSDDPITRNTTYLSVSKNRFCGRTGSAGSLLFNHETYSFEEIA